MCWNLNGTPFSFFKHRQPPHDAAQPLMQTPQASHLIPRSAKGTMRLRGSGDDSMASTRWSLPGEHEKWPAHSQWSIENHLAPIWQGWDAKKCSLNFQKVQCHAEHPRTHWAGKTAVFTIYSFSHLYPFIMLEYHWCPFQIRWTEIGEASNFWVQPYLVGGFSPPLWKIWVRQLGWFDIPNIHGKMPKMATISHQPDIIYIMINHSLLMV